MCQSRPRFAGIRQLFIEKDLQFKLISRFQVGNRKLLQNVGQIICDALGNCDDGHGRKYYDDNHDQR